MYDPYFERLAGWAIGPRFDAEIARARTEFFEGTGAIHEDDHAFEHRMSGLSEYYLMDRPLDGDAAGRTPARLFLEEEGDGLTTGDRSAYRNFTRTLHGVFEIRKLTRDGVVVRDLFTAEDHRVLERRQMTGLGKGDVVEARLIPWDEHLLFSRAFIFHPREARKLVLGWAKRLRKSKAIAGPEARRGAVWTLARTTLVHDRQRQNNRAPPRVDLIYGAL
jgi:hypothetical protein